MACSTAICARWRFSCTASIAEFVISVSTTSIITAGGLTTALERGTTDSFSPSWVLPFSWLEIAAHSTVVDWNPCNDLLFSGEEAILCGYQLQVGKQFFFRALCSCGGLLQNIGYDCHLTACSAFLLSCSPHKKGYSSMGISTYDYIVTLREQEQQLVGGQQSTQMSPASSVTGLSSASSFNTFHRAAWCSPPRLFLEDQFDVVPPDTNMPLSSSGKRMVGEQPIRKNKPGTVKINPWMLARLNGDEVSKVAAEAKKKSKILQPLGRREGTLGLEMDSSYGSSGRMVPRPENRRRTSKRIRLPADLPLEILAKISAKTADNYCNDLVPETIKQFGSSSA